MRSVLMVLRREYLDRVRKKSFWIGTLIFPLLMTGLVFGQFALLRLKSGEQRTVAVVDTTGRLAEPLDRKLGERKLKDGRREFVVESVAPGPDLEETVRSLEPRVVSGELFGVLTVGSDLDAKDNFRLYVRNVGNILASQTLENALEHAVVGERLERSDVRIERETLDRITAPVDLRTLEVSAEGGAREKSFETAYFGTFAFVLILYMSLLIYGIAAMRGILEEKSNRIMEVLLGSLTPEQLMTGKILGIGLAGLTQMAIYVVAGLGLRLYVAAAGSEAWLRGIADALTPVKLLAFLVYFLLGYFFYVALFAAIGAVCNTEQEAQNLQTGVVMCLVVPMIATFFFINNPDGTAAVVTSLIPLFTPMVMFMRISTIAPPAWEIALSLILMVGTIYLVFRFVARIFRIGILMYGKRPTIPEILRWARG